MLIPRAEIARRIGDLGVEIARDLERLGPDEEVEIVAILTGSFMFLADLIRRLPGPLRVRMVAVSSYPGRATKPRPAEILSRLPDDVAGRHVIVIDDILDSGQTLRLIRAELARRRPKSIRACVLLRKRRSAAMAEPCEYVGFDIPDEFVVGYGLDFDDLYRNLPDICTLRSPAP